MSAKHKLVLSTALARGGRGLHAQSRAALTHRQERFRCWKEVLLEAQIAWQPIPLSTAGVAAHTRALETARARGQHGRRAQFRATVVRE